MEVSTGALKFSDLKLKFDKESREISSIRVFAKDANSFTYVLPSKFFPINSTENMQGLPCVLEGFATPKKT